MRVAMKSDDGNDSLDTFIRQAIGKDPLVPFSRTGNSPVQWIQLLNALEQPDIHGWPLMTPVKVQMQKCEKCSKEFCSPINYKRHIRVHRRSLNVKKESHKNRDLLALFWDKLSVEEASEIVSFNDVMLKEIPGSSILKALASSLRKPEMWTLPQVYVKAGSTLSDIIHAKPSRVPISSQELFSILDDASEGTFLCAGTAESMLKYLFDGETAKNSLELKNLVSCTCFLFEQLLVRAWIADKDAEALRCHKLLVEEEDAAQKRQAELLDRKRQKKIRQKEQKFKERLHEDSEFTMDIAVDARNFPVLAETADSPSPSNLDSNSPDILKFLDPYLGCNQSHEQEIDIEAQVDVRSEQLFQSDSHVIDHSIMVDHDHQHLVVMSRQDHKSQKAFYSGFHGGENVQMLKPDFRLKPTPPKNQTSGNGSKVWTKKYKVKSDELLKSTFQEVTHGIEETNCEVMIGSIPVALEIHDSHEIDFYGDKIRGTLNSVHPILPKNTAPEKLIEVQDGQSSTIQFLNGYVDSDGRTKSFEVQDRLLSHGRCSNSHSSEEETVCDEGKHSYLLSEEIREEENLQFSSTAAKEFLSQRWKKAISTDHTKLVLSSGTGDWGDQSSDLVVSQENYIGRNYTNKSAKPEKNMKIQYVPKPKVIV